jgi:hypothetical protein
VTVLRIDGRPLLDRACIWLDPDEVRSLPQDLNWKPIASLSGDVLPTDRSVGVDASQANSLRIVNADGNHIHGIGFEDAHPADWLDMVKTFAVVGLMRGPEITSFRTADDALMAQEIVLVPVALFLNRDGVSWA